MTPECAATWGPGDSLGLLALLVLPAEGLRGVKGPKGPTGRVGLMALQAYRAGAPEQQSDCSFWLRLLEAFLVQKVR